MTPVYEGLPLALESGNIKAFKPKEQFGLMLIEGTGTLTLSYSLDGVHWDDEDKTFTIPAGGHINIEVNFVRFAFYKVTTTGSITGAKIKYD